MIDKFLVYNFWQVRVSLGWWSKYKETHRSFCSKICGLFDELDRNSARWWINFSPKFGWVISLYDVHNTPIKISSSLSDQFYATGTPFPSNFQDVVKTIFKRLFRVYAHIYHSHFQKIVSLKEEAHLNTCFKHFVLYTWVSSSFHIVDLMHCRKLLAVICSSQVVWGRKIEFPETSC